MFVVLKLNVADVQKAIATDAEIDERGLDTGLQVDDPAFVDVADAAFETVPLDVKLFKNAIFDNANPALFRLADVDQHFLLHT